MKAIFSESFCDFGNLGSEEVEVVGVLPVKSEEAISFAKKNSREQKKLRIRIYLFFKSR